MGPIYKALPLCTCTPPRVWAALPSYPPIVGSTRITLTHSKHKIPSCQCLVEDQRSGTERYCAVYMIEKGGTQQQQPHQPIFQQRHIQTSVVVGLLSGFRVCFFFLFILWLRASRESSN